MPRIKNISGYDLTVPSLGRLVLAGQVVEVPAEDAPSYTCQASVWQDVSTKKGER